jgi:hypothetical protein
MGTSVAIQRLSDSDRPEQERSELLRRLRVTHPTTVVGNSNDNGSGWRDHTPIKLVSEVLEQTAGADASGAYDAVDGYLRSHPDLTTKKCWMVHKRG